MFINSRNLNISVASIRPADTRFRIVLLQLLLLGLTPFMQAHTGHFENQTRPPGLIEQLSHLPSSVDLAIVLGLLLLTLALTILAIKKYRSEQAEN